MAHQTKSSSIDSFLQHTVKFTSSAANQDKGLKLFQWTLLLASKLFHSKNKREGVAKVSTDISFARYLLRFYGLPACIEAIRSGSWGGSSKWSKLLGKAMAWSMLVYYPLEHVAYLKWTSPHVVPKSIRANQWSAISCRFWLVYLVCEMIQSVLHLREMEKNRETLRQHDDDKSDQVAQLTRSMTNTELQLVRSALFTLPCLEWSLPRWDTHPWLDTSVVNGLMWLESVVSMYQSVLLYKNSSK